MKKIIFPFVFITLFHFTVQGQFRLGPEIGLNMSNINETGNSTSPLSGLGIGNIAGLSSSYTSTYGIRVGIAVEYAFNENLALQSGLYYSMMGAKTGAQSVSVTTYKLSIGSGSKNINYVHIPLNIIYKIDAGPGKFFIGAGPYISYALSGTNKTGAVTLDTIASLPSTSTNINFGSDTASTKALDYGVNVLAGYELPGGLLFKVGYSYGLANFSNQNGTTDKNTCIFLSAAWLFSNTNSHKRY